MDYNNHFTKETCPSKKLATMVDVVGCRWPVGEHPTLFCNMQQDDKYKQPYCTHHAKLAYKHVSEKAIRRGKYAIS